MEIHFQQSENNREAEMSMSKMSKTKGRIRSNNNNNNSNNGGNKFVGVRQRPSGRWVAEIKDTTQKIRMWLGTFHTAEEAARAYDEAACLLRGSNTRTNFSTPLSFNSPIAFRIRNLLNSRKSPTKQTQISNQNLQSTSNPSSISTSSSSPSPIPTISIEESLDSSSGWSNNGMIEEDTQLGYKSEMSDLNEGREMGYSESEISWGYGEEIVELTEKNDELGDGENGKMEFSEFERMKVERQISASLYAMNGVHEYMETVHYDPNESIWDLPPLCSSFFCSL